MIQEICSHIAEQITRTDAVMFSDPYSIDFFTRDYQQNVTQLRFSQSAYPFEAGTYIFCARVYGLWTPLSEFVVGGPRSVEVRGSSLGSSASLMETFELALYGSQLRSDDILYIIPASFEFCSRATNFDTLSLEETGLESLRHLETEPGFVHRASFNRAGRYLVCWCSSADGSQCSDVSSAHTIAFGSFSVAGPIEVWSQYYQELVALVDVPTTILVEVVTPVTSDLGVHLYLRPAGCCHLPFASHCQDLLTPDDFELQIESAVQGPDSVSFSGIRIPFGGYADLCYCSLSFSVSGSPCDKIGNNRINVVGKGSSMESFWVQRLINTSADISQYSFSRSASAPIISNFGSRVVEGSQENTSWISTSRGYGYSLPMVVYVQSDPQSSGRCKDGFRSNTLVGKLLQEMQIVDSEDPRGIQFQVRHQHALLNSPGHYVLCCVFEKISGIAATPLGKFEVRGPASVVAVQSRGRQVHFPLMPGVPIRIEVEGHLLQKNDRIRLRSIHRDRNGGCGVQLHATESPAWITGPLPRVADAVDAGVKLTYSMVFQGAGEFAVCMCGADWHLDCSQQDNFVSQPLGSPRNIFIKFQSSRDTDQRHSVTPRKNMTKD